MFARKSLAVLAVLFVGFTVQGCATQSSGTPPVVDCSYQAWSDAGKDFPPPYVDENGKEWHWIQRTPENPPDNPPLVRPASCPL